MQRVPCLNEAESNPVKADIQQLVTTLFILYTTFLPHQSRDSKLLTNLRGSGKGYQTLEGSKMMDAAAVTAKVKELHEAGAAQRTEVCE